METKNRPAALESHLGYWLRFVSNSVSGAFAEKLAAQGISVAEWVVLRLVHGDATTLPASAIAEAAGMTRGAISKIVDKLEARDLLERKPLPQDGRAQILKLTAKGARLVPALAELADQNDAEFFDHLTAKERETMLRILKGIVARRGLKTIPVD
ncbi:MAG TPA: MarR family transcriptional regulator [Rhizomicrobium sp.]|nr:MarR family transcriptional regulator [Rhizomicrobium sp.]